MSDSYILLVKDAIVRTDKGFLEFRIGTCEYGRLSIPDEVEEIVIWKNEYHNAGKKVYSGVITLNKRVRLTIGVEYLYYNPKNYSVYAVI